MFENLYGLSCIENQVLAILREHGTDIRPLYRDCAMPMKELFFFLIYHGNKQEYFDRITRVQDLAKEIGIISMKLDTDDEKALAAIRNTHENEYILIRVSEEFTKEKLHARGLRSDHYVRASAAGSGIEIFNDIPEMSLILTEKEFAEAGGGDFFRIRIKREITLEDQKKLHASRVFKAERTDAFHFEASDFDPIRRFPNEPKDTGIRIKNMTGVYKTLRYRMAEYYGQHTDTVFIREYMPEIEKYYAMFEYYNLKRNASFEQYFDVFCRLNQLDNDLNEKLKKQLYKSY